MQHVSPKHKNEHKCHATPFLGRKCVCYLSALCSHCSCVSLSVWPLNQSPKCPFRNSLLKEVTTNPVQRTSYIHTLHFCRQFLYLPWAISWSAFPWLLLCWHSLTTRKGFSCPAYSKCHHGSRKLLLCHCKWLDSTLVAWSYRCVRFKYNPQQISGDSDEPTKRKLR